MRAVGNFQLLRGLIRPSSIVRCYRIYPAFSQRVLHTKRRLQISQSRAGTAYFGNGLLGDTASRGFASERLLATFEEQVLEKLREVKLDESRNIVSAGLVKELVVEPTKGQVKFVFLSNDAYLQEKCVSALQALEWLKETPVIQAALSGQTKSASTKKNTSQNSGISNIKNIIAVSSCKGGVGKSTVAVNLAASLQGKGHKVGLLDADVYGPSLPTMMVGKNDSWSVSPTADKTMVKPVVLHGITCMSYGFVAPGTGGRRDRESANESNRGMEADAAILRGPMVSSIVEQLTKKTLWGELDYLIIDMPPGTGDIHLTLCQQMDNKIDAAVIVTTPQRLSFVDVVKGIDMFHRLNVPTIAVVENMAWFKGDSGKKYYPFGMGHKDQLVERYGIKHSYSLPISRTTSAAGDAGLPFMASGTPDQLQEADLELWDTYMQLAAGVETETETIKNEGSTFNMFYDQDRNLIVVRSISDTSAVEHTISPLRFRQQLSGTSDMLGIQKEDIPEDVFPETIDFKGKYAVGIEWSDGYDASIYAKDDILNLFSQT